MVVALFMTVGCIDIPAMNGLIDRIVPEEPRSYQSFEVWNVKGDFAPDPEQDNEALMKAIADMLNDPLQFQQTATPVLSATLRMAAMTGSSAHPPWISRRICCP